MAKTFKIEIVTPEGTVLSTEAAALKAPAWEGYLGVLAGHAPLLCVLRPGVLTVRDKEWRPAFFAIKGGFMEVGPEHVVVLADAIEKGEDIDGETAKRALDESMKPFTTGALAEATIESRRVAREVAVEKREESKAWAAARLRATELCREPE